MPGEDLAPSVQASMTLANLPRAIANQAGDPHVLRIGSDFSETDTPLPTWQRAAPISQAEARGVAHWLAAHPDETIYARRTGRHCWEFYVSRGQAARSEDRWNVAAALLDVQHSALADRAKSEIELVQKRLEEFRNVRFDPQKQLERSELYARKRKLRSEISALLNELDRRVSLKRAVETLQRQNENGKVADDQFRLTGRELRRILDKVLSA